MAGEIVEDLGDNGGHAESFAGFANRGFEQEELAEIAERAGAARGDFADGQGAEDDGKGSLHFGFGGGVVLEEIQKEGFVDLIGGAVAEFFEVAVGTAEALSFVVGGDGVGAITAVGELIFAEVPSHEGECTKEEYRNLVTACYMGFRKARKDVRKVSVVRITERCRRRNCYPVNQT